MFLISEESVPVLEMPQAGGVLDSRSRGSRFSLVEHEDSISGVEFFLKQFSYDEKLNYPIGATGLRADIWAEMVRTISLATVQARSSHQQPGFTSAEFPALDGLAIRLLEKLFQNQYGSPNGAQFRMFNQRYNGFKKSFRDISFYGAVSELNGVHLRTNSRKPEPTLVSREFSFQSVGKRQKLSFEVILENGLPVDLKLSRRCRPVNPEADSILRDIRSILQDQRERLVQAKLCLETPVALGPSPELVYSIVGKLADLGFPSGSYSRSSLGAGVFPSSRYSHKVLSMETRLTFGHCDRCHSLKFITADEATREQVLGLESLSRELILPWHESICGKSPKEIEREDRLKLLDQKERELRRERSLRSQLKRNPDYYRKQSSYHW